MLIHNAFWSGGARKHRARLADCGALGGGAAESGPARSAIDDAPKPTEPYHVLAVQRERVSAATDPITGYFRSFGRGCVIYPRNLAQQSGLLSLNSLSCEQRPLLEGTGKRLVGTGMI